MTTKAIINGPVVSKKKLEIIQAHSGVEHNILGMVHQVASQGQDQSVELIIGNARVQFSEGEYEAGEEAVMKERLLSNLQQDDSVLALVVPEGQTVPERDPGLAGDELRMLGISIQEPVVPAQESLDNIVRRQLGLDPIPTQAEIEETVRRQVQGTTQPAIQAGSISIGTPVQMQAPEPPVFQPQEAFVVTMTFTEVQSETILASSQEEAQRIADDKARLQHQVFQGLGKHVVVSTDVRAVVPRQSQVDQPVSSHEFFQQTTPSAEQPEIQGDF